MKESGTTLIGTVERITFASDETGYTVIKLLPESPLSFWDSVNPDGTITVTGVFPDLVIGETIELIGSWSSHPRFGEQFKVETFKRSAPTTLPGITRYLGSGMIKGIGPKTAESIVSAFGKETLTILDEQPERLYEVKGVGRHRVHVIMQAWQEQKAIRDVMLFLQSQGVSPSLAVRIYKTYGDESIARVQENPYQLADEIHGIGFKTADQIAMNTGLAADHPKRLSAGLIYALSQAAKDGDVFLPKKEIFERSRDLLGVSETSLEDILKAATSDGSVILSPYVTQELVSEAVYLPEYYHAEVGTSRRLVQMMESGSAPLISPLLAPQNIADVSAQGALKLTDRQIEAVLTALTHHVSVITGGPGTGKTTIIKTLIQILEQHNLTYVLASPTGRAAKRLSGAAGAPASTIHRMLGYSPAGGWGHDAFQPIIADLVIIDEASMIDIQLANALLRGIHPAAHLVFVGDVDQLPSVGAGDFLRDLIDSQAFPTIRLDVIFRQEAGSTIIRNAHRIQSGEMPILPEDSRDFFLFKIADDPERAAALIVDVVKNRLPDSFKVDPVNDIQVIVPMYRGEAGISRLNIELQQVLNPPRGQVERIISGRIFRVGDKVLQTSNDYEREIYNGDIGRIIRIDEEEAIVSVDFDSRVVSFDFTEAGYLLHAYAISVHRAQGSEYPVIVMPVITQHYVMLQRNLLYTAITRAREIVVLIGSLKAIGIAVKNDAVTSRFSLLKQRLRGEI